ncbi:MAG: response regulator [Magnetococcus sp. YQC-3]
MTPCERVVAPILVIDDEADNLLIIAEFLRQAGYRSVTVTADARQGVALFAEGAFALVLLDIMMPGMDGFAVMARMKEVAPARQCPILVLTARQDEKTRLRALREGAKDFLSKPFLEEELLCRVANLLEMEMAQQNLLTFNQSLEALLRQRTQDLDLRNQQLMRSQLETLDRLGRAAEFRDNETGLHVLRMSHYAERLGRAMGLDEGEAALLLHSAPMHDIGKVGIPDAILLKPGRLDPAEWVVMRRHPAIGAEILANATSPWLESSRVIALSHHERWNGDGYPGGLRGEEIPLFGRIVAVADVFDALTSARPYKSAWPVERAVVTLQEGSGSHFDPRIVAVFIDLLPEMMAIKAHYQEGEQP